MKTGAQSVQSPDYAAIESIYQEHVKSGSAIAPHLPTLRRLACDCKTVVEFGVKNGASTTAFLSAGCEVTSYDIVETRRARELERLAGKTWTYRVQDSRTAEQVDCDLLFIDSLHTYDQCKAELARMGNHARKYLVFHDTIIFGSVGALGETGKHAEGVLGIRPAIDEFMIEWSYRWRLQFHDVHSAGLLVLRRTTA
jgi:hypothetical protein